MDSGYPHFTANTCRESIARILYLNCPDDWEIAELLWGNEKTGWDSQVVAHST